MTAEDAQWVFPLIMYGVWLFALLLVAAAMAFSGGSRRPDRPATRTAACELCRIYPLQNCHTCSRGKATR